MDRCGERAGRAARRSPSSRQSRNGRKAGELQPARHGEDAVVARTILLVEDDAVRSLVKEMIEHGLA